MSPTHLHLLVNHLAIMGVIIAIPLLSYGVLVKSRHTRMAAYSLIIIAVMAGIVAFVTGEAAEHTVENLNGVNKSAMGAHEEAGEVAVMLISILGLTAIIGLFTEIKSKTWGRNFPFLVLIIAFISAILVARVGWLGGQIRHTEIAPASMQLVQPKDKFDND